MGDYESETLSIFSTQVDKSQVPAIHQKRILAFVNHFIITTVSFLNKFVNTCETKFVTFESKLLKLEASLAIVESKLASINDQSGNKGAENVTHQQAVDVDELKTPEELTEHPAKEELPTTDVPPVEIETVSGVKVRDDSRYQRFFKMLQFGVPVPAVKLKMTSEGLDPNMLDNPDAILADGCARQED